MPPMISVEVQKQLFLENSTAEPFFKRKTFMSLKVRMESNTTRAGEHWILPAEPSTLLRNCQQR